MNRPALNTDKLFYIHTFGCQMNRYDSERISQHLRDAGWQETQNETQAHLLLANTCTVRRLAEEKAFSLLGRWAQRKKKQPEIIIGMVGCLAQHLQAAIFRRAPAIDFLAGPRAIVQIPQLVEKARFEKHTTDFALYPFGPGVTQTPPHSVSAFVAVMEGCNEFCSYCAVPRSRGREMSRTPEDILHEIKSRLANGTKEIILLGQNITRYGQDLNNPRINLAQLLYQVNEIRELVRLRFLTSHPKAFTPELLQAMIHCSKVCKSLHLPLQSGSNQVLAAMRRTYTAEEYIHQIEDIRAVIPDLALSTDLIVGFPVETEKDFKATLAVVEKVNFDNAYCFKFSPRSGTVAALMSDTIALEIKEKRLEQLLQLITEQSRAAKMKMLGRHTKVLIERKIPKTPPELQGKTGTNHLVTLPGPEEWVGKEVETQIIAASSWSLTGEP